MQTGRNPRVKTIGKLTQEVECVGNKRRERNGKNVINNHTVKLHCNRISGVQKVTCVKCEMIINMSLSMTRGSLCGLPSRNPLVT